jgi:hypothetical protein
MVDDVRRIIADIHHRLRRRDAVVEAIVEGEVVTHSQRGPYSARSASDNTEDWPLWYVAGADGRINGMRFQAQPGLFTSRDEAEAIAAALNAAMRD